MRSKTYTQSQFIHQLYLATIALSLAISSHVASADEPSKAELAAAKKVVEAGGRVNRIAQNSDTNEISFAFSRLKINDKSLANIHEVPKVVQLRLQNTEITDAGLAQVAKLEDLTSLNLKDTKIGDAGIKHLTGLKKLEYLNLYGTKVTNDCIASLKGMTSIKKVYFAGTKVDGSGLEELRAALPEASINGAAKLPPPPKDPLAEGKFVRVRLAGPDRILSLAEVEVIGLDDTPLHKAGKATQSSLYQTAQAGLAIDGKTDGVFANKSVTHTRNQLYPWWQVELAEAKAIRQIVVWNRAKVGDRLSNAVVEILDENHQVKWSATIDDAKDGSKHEFTAE